MNLEESNEFVERMEKNNRNKKNIITVLGVCAVIVVILFGLIGYIRYQDSLKLKIFLDNNQINFSSSFLYDEENVSYVSVKELCRNAWIFIS